MNFEAYSEFVKNTKKPIEKTLDPVLIEGLMGLVEESMEVLQLFKKDILYGRGIDRDHLVAELGDVFYYLTYIMSTANITIDELMNYNMQKLTKRRMIHKS